ncbi:MAG: MerR family transcriptional regulator, partial [Comamonadaceae bacterium]
PTTLRVWERRYGVVAGKKTATGQREYSQHDVARLRLLRQLTLTGHAIGSIATLDLAALQSLRDGLPGASDDRAPARTVHAVVVGRRAAHALEAVAGCSVRAVHNDLDLAAAAPPPDHAVDLLLVRLASLQPATVDRVLALAASMRAGAIAVIYAFGTDASADALRDAGVAVFREPLGSSLARWLHSVKGRPAEAAATVQPETSVWPVAPPRFSDEALARFANLPPPVACECLRHLVEIVTQLGAFERYSQDCTSAGPADAALHRQLARTSGAARMMFEQALQRVVEADGLAG